MPTTLEQIQYGFDRDSRRTWQKRPLTSLQDQAYQYDPLSQVNAAARGSLNLNGTAISGTPTLAESWAFDPTGNWRGYQASTAGTVTLDQHRVHDRGNRLTQIEGNPHNQVLDRAGRVRQTAPDAAGDWNGKLEITWDAWSRITRVKSNGTVVGDYRYDGQHRRTERTVNGGETHHSYYNDQWRPVEERKNSETTASVSYLWGSRHRDDLVRRDRAVGGTSLNETRYVMMDYFNPAAITDAAGVVKERYAFSAFGVRTILNPDYSTRSSSESGMEFGFQGQFLDGESGLMNYGYRYYAPRLGRWTCKDPVENIDSLYVISGNHPINEIDHLGAETYAQFVKRCEQSAKPKCQSQGRILVSWRVVGAGAGVRPSARGYQFWAAWVCEVKCGECSPEEKARRQAIKNAACGQERSCKNTDHCAKIRRCIQSGMACEQARRLVMDCFNGGDQAHKDELQEVMKTTLECMRKYVALGCDRQR